ncbi:MAG: stage V sporulation protein AD [Oscillospiraceae bacterium]|nr:stage V sporulation protein AD [Oscillospiraceae bacterium]
MGLITLQNPPSLRAWASVGGKWEKEGPLGSMIDFSDESDKFGQPTWEKSESKMQNTALKLALMKEKIQPSDIGAVFAGDLLNQCTSSTYGLLDFDLPYFGLYGACSTCAEGLMLAAMTTSAGYYSRAAVVSSSHFCPAERQFRTPLEHGAQRAPTSQRTVTGAGAFIIDANCGTTRITQVMAGKIVDSGISDVNNMGAAMAPAAIASMSEYFTASGTKPADFDLILTGDLAREGSEIFCEFMNKRGFDMAGVHKDGGKIIFDENKQDVQAGGSGCGCCAVVLAADILPRLVSGELKNVLFMATGALMSPTSIQQGENILGIAHIVRLEGGNP